ncbi:MAG: hypothetical protein JEZ08_15690 [Clostridiales bacterium]|nr:hypothetical protein [Clostridiales bacterium]
MKKIVIILCIILLVGCQKTPPQKTVKKIEKEPEVVEEIEYVEYVNKDQLKALMIKTNGETKIIDLDVLHTMLSGVLLREIDLSIEIDAQSDLIEDIVYEELIKWRRDIVEDILDQEQVILNEDDFETLISRTSIKDAFQLMLSYETIFLKKQVE